MNEYIILHLEEPDIKRVSMLFSLQDIVRWIPNNTGSDIFFFDRISNQKRFITTIESPLEIEALIMGSWTQSLAEENAKLKHELQDTEEACDKYSRLWSGAIRDFGKLREENVRLKEINKFNQQLKGENNGES